MLQAASGLGLSLLAPTLDLKAAQERGAERPKSLIVLWMNGGPSQLETWDPHPNSPTSRETQAIKTPVSGLEICDLYPRMAEQIGELNVLRSLVSKEGDHERGAYFVKTGYRPNPIQVHAAMTSLVSYHLPAEGLEIPPHVSLCNSPWPARGGYLGASHDAFRVFNPGRNLGNLKAPVQDSRQQRRLESLNVVSRAFARGRRVQTERTLHQLTIERALQMMNSDQLKAFEIDDESESTKAGYGDTQFGRGCLVARRLVETGVRAIEVTLNGWDSHASNYTGHVTQAEQLDPAFSSLIIDLKERDLLDSTIVLCIGEFGRTPTINPLDGRDHWPKWFSCVVGGGGLSIGQVIGETDPAGKKDPTEPSSVEDLYATILQKLGLDYQEEFVTGIGRPIMMSKGSPIERLLG